MAKTTFFLESYLLRLKVREEYGIRVARWNTGLELLGIRAASLRERNTGLELLDGRYFTGLAGILLLI